MPTVLVDYFLIMLYLLIVVTLVCLWVGRLQTAFLAITLAICHIQAFFYIGVRRIAPHSDINLLITTTLAATILGFLVLVVIVARNWQKERLQQQGSD